MADSGYKGISRIEQEPSGKGNSRRGRTAGWYARIWWQREEHSKYFGDATYGGRDKALAEAVAWRNAKEVELGKPRTELPVAVYLAGEAGAEEVRFAVERLRVDALFAQKVRCGNGDN